MFRIIVRGQYGKRNEQSLNKIEMKAKANMIRLGQWTVDTMRQEIENAKRRSGGDQKLEKSIKWYVDYIAGMISVGVGMIAELPKYWRAVNDGSGHIVGRGVPGHFGGAKPIAGRSGERFTHERKTYFMTPKRPIPAMNYIERTVAKVSAIITGIFGR